MRTLPKNRISNDIWKAKSSFANWYRNKLLNFLETVFSSIYKVPIIAALMFTVFKCGAQSSAASAKVARGARSLGRQQTSAHSNSWKIHTCLYMYKPARQRGALQSRTVGAENCCCMLSGVCVCRDADAAMATEGKALQHRFILKLCLVVHGRVCGNVCNRWQ